VETIIATAQIAITAAENALITSSRENLDGGCEFAKFIPF
jgi:hypothetical protein